MLTLSLAVGNEVWIIMKTTIYSGLIVLVLVSLTAWSDPSPLERRATISSGYIEGYFNSNEGLVHFPLTAMQGYSKLFDVVAENFADHWGKRLLVAILELPVSYWLAPALFTPFHEFGHARVIKAMGESYSYSSAGYGRTISGLTNYWSLSALRLITPPIGFLGNGIASAAGRLSLPKNDLQSEKAYVGLHATRVVLSAGGLNNQMFLAKKIATMIYERNGHMTYLPHYVGNKISGFVYAIMDQDKNPNNDPLVNGSSDPGSIIRGYQNLGLSINHRDLKILSLASLLSGTTASLFKGYYDYLHHNDPVVRPLELFGIRFPELNGYINASGLSFEVESDYRIAPYLTAGLAYEFIWKGRPNHNVTPRARYNLAHAVPVLNELWLRADVVIGKGVGGSFGADYAPFSLERNNFWSRLAYSADVHIYNTNTLYGERNIVSATFGKTVAADAVIAVHMRY